MLSKLLDFHTSCFFPTFTVSFYDLVGNMFRSFSQSPALYLQNVKGSSVKVLQSVLPLASKYTDPIFVYLISFNAISSSPALPLRYKDLISLDEVGGKSLPKETILSTKVSSTSKFWRHVFCVKFDYKTAVYYSDHLKHT